MKLSKELRDALSIRTARAKISRDRKAIEHTILRKGAVTLTGGTYGAMSLFKVPNDIKGFPWKLGVWTLTTVGEVVTDGGLQAFLGGVSDATMAVYMERSIATKSIVAGDTVGDAGTDGGEF